MALPKIKDAPRFAIRPQCDGRGGDIGPDAADNRRCNESAVVWFVSDDDVAVCAYCQFHADKVLAEYARAAERHPDQCGDLARWYTSPIVMAENYRAP